MAHHRFGDMRIQLFVVDLLPCLRRRNMNTSAGLIDPAWQNRQNGDLDIVGPIQLTEVSDAAPTVGTGINFQPIPIAVVVKPAVE